MASKKIKGRIIRILDKKSVVINLGREQGIEDESIFYILGEPESVIDPMTNEVLGTVSVAKSRVRASQVFDKFTIATTSWTTVTYSVYAGILENLTGGARTQTIDEGELKVSPDDVKPWKAKSESPVKVGDEVEVKINEPEEEEDNEESATAETQSGNK
jgi:acyl-CoA reductase-like NAD-dependent aldehyde dehydrogenase